jgi:hypothetical protein
MMQAGIRNLPGAVIIGGGLVDESAVRWLAQLECREHRGGCRRSLRRGRYKSHPRQTRFLEIDHSSAALWHRAAVAINVHNFGLHDQIGFQERKI